MDNQESIDTTKFLKIKDVAKLTGFSEQYLRKLDNNGTFKCHHRSEKGGYRYYTEEQVASFLEANGRGDYKPSTKFLKIKEVAQLTGLSEQCLRNWDDNGTFKCHHKSEKGGYRYYTLEQVDEYLKMNSKKEALTETKFLKIKEVAQLTGLSEQCLRNWDDSGIFKCHHKSEKGGYRYYTLEQVEEYLNKTKNRVKVVGYCRVSVSDSKDLERQSKVIKDYVSSNSLDNNFVLISDVSNGIDLGEGLKGLIKDISENLVKELIIEDKTRLSIADFNLIHIVAKVHNCKVTVLSEATKVGVDNIITDAAKVIDVISKSLKINSKEKLKSLLNEIVDVI